MKAIVYYCFGSDYYITGLLASLHALNKIKPEDVKTVILVDEYIFNFVDLISQFADRIILIDPPKLEGYYLNHSREKYRMEWVDNIINKWRCLSLTEYEMILFLDIDILPIKKKMFDLFDKYKNFDIVFQFRRIKGRKVFYHSLKIKKRKYPSFKKFMNNNQDYINAGFVLLKPSMKLYNAIYDNFEEANIKNKKFNMSGIDETFLYFKTLELNLKFTQFSKSERPIIPWVDTDIEKCSVLNYLSEVKPFVKSVENMWKEEYIWDILLNELTEYPLINLLRARNIMKDKGMKVADSSGKEVEELLLHEEEYLSYFKTISPPTLNWIVVDSSILMN